jgi:NADH-quinone oxidoreductase subunit J
VIADWKIVFRSFTILGAVDSPGLQGLLHDYWPLLISPLLGFVAVYWLLPQARGSKPVLGTLLGGVAIVIGALVLVRVDTNLAEAILFYAFSGLAILGGGLMLSQRNPVHAALSFALVVLSTCGLFLLQAAPFLMAATIVVYAGAIIVTFLFVIMLAQQEGMASADQRSREPFLASLAGFVLLAAILCIVHRNYDTSKIDGLLEPIKAASRASTAADIRRILGAKDDLATLDLELVKELKVVFPDPDDAELFHKLEYTVQLKPMKVESVKKLCEEILAVCLPGRLAHGSLLPGEKLALSKQSGVPPNMPLIVGPDGRLAERMPAANVAGLGRSLFTDYLVPVQLAAVLLLVATVGAIAIAGRRGEGLR